MMYYLYVSKTQCIVHYRYGTVPYGIGTCTVHYGTVRFQTFSTVPYLTYFYVFHILLRYGTVPWDLYQPQTPPVLLQVIKHLEGLVE